MASITKRRNAYQVQIRRKDAAAVSKCFRSLAEARAWARQTESSIDKGNSAIATVRAAAMPTLHDALTRYAAEVVPLKKGASREASLVRCWQQHVLSKKALASLTPRDLSAYRDEQLGDGKAPATVLRSLALISHVYTVAVKDWGYSLDNPVMKMRKPRAVNARTRRPSTAEIEALCKHLPSDEMRAFVLLAADTAMRRGELFSLTWAQVDLDKRTVFLPDTKNGSSRTVIISSRAAGVFKSLQESLPGKAPNRGSERVFSFVHCDTPSKAFSRGLAAARRAYIDQCLAQPCEPEEGFLEGLRLHDMRHEATSKLFELGLSSMEVASITGHKTLSMLQRYTHLSSEHLLTKLG